MKLFFSVLLTVIIWVVLYRIFFYDREDFWENAKENTVWLAASMIFDTPFGGIRFLIFLAAGILGGFLLYHNL